MKKYVAPPVVEVRPPSDEEWYKLADECLEQLMSESADHVRYSSLTYMEDKMRRLIFTTTSIALCYTALCIIFLDRRIRKLEEKVLHD